MSRILYGVQGTGNGHISRANAMAEAFRQYPGLQIDWLLSGRDKAAGCGIINNFQWREGLSFVVEAGRVKVLKTLRKNRLLQFRHDIRDLDLSPYDLVISDFEPISCHAARRKGIPVTGIGHQYAFNYPVPLAGADFISRSIMRHYAPVTHAVGLHWHHFGQAILPPILDIKTPHQSPALVANKVVVYLPFENATAVCGMLQDIRSHNFHIYHPALQHADHGHIHTRPLSRHGFKADLLDAERVITNSGFELISECLQLGKAVLTRPLQGQMEQLSNARALQELGYATVIDKLDSGLVRNWLQSDIRPVKLSYPDVAGRLARWIAEGCGQELHSLSQELWQSPVNTRSYGTV